MNYLETMSQSVASVKENDLRFGPAEGVFETTAKLSSLMLDKELTPYDVVTVLRCLNDARKKYNPTGPYHYIENINLEAFALQFAVVQDARSEAAAAEVAEKFAASACPSSELPVDPFATTSGAGFP